jgi:hypothetical protein
MSIAALTATSSARSATSTAVLQRQPVRRARGVAVATLHQSHALLRRTVLACLGSAAAGWAIILAF